MSNYSFYAIPMGWALSMWPHVVGTQASKSFDARSPRTYVETISKDQKIPQSTKDYIVRCEAAQSNGFENLALFACAVTAGNVAGLPASTLNTLTYGYLVSRVAYNLIYMNNTTEGMAKLRSVAYLAGIGQIFTLFVQAGNVLREKGSSWV